MDTEVLTVDAVTPAPDAIARAAAVLLRGGLVAFPTETVYGLGALADDAACVARIFAAKGRPAYNPLIAHVTDAAMARALVRAWPPAAARLAAAHWPGPLTLVVARDPARIPDVVSAGRPTVAVRAPAHPVARALLAAVGRPVAAPSANRFQQLSPTTAAHVLKGLAGRVDLVLDGGPCPYGIESTVVDVTVDPPVLLRPGALPLAALAPLAPGLRLRAPAPHDDDDEAARPSPGMVRRHYAPRARLVVATPDAVDAAVDALRAEGLAVALVTRGRAARGDVVVRALPDDPAAYAAALFATLHALDDGGCGAVVVEAVPDDDAWAAVRDRLARASAE